MILLHACVLSCFSGIQLCDPMDHTLPGSSVHGVFPERILEWVAMPSSRASSWPRAQTCVSCIAGRFFTTELPGRPLRSVQMLHVPVLILSIFTCSRFNFLTKNFPFSVWSLLFKLLTQWSIMDKLAILDALINFGLSTTHTHTIRFIFLSLSFLLSLLAFSSILIIFSFLQLKSRNIHFRQYLMNLCPEWLFYFSPAWNTCKASPFSPEHSDNLW